MNWWNGQQWVWQDQGTPPSTAVGGTIVIGPPSVITFQGAAGSQAIYAFDAGNGRLYVNWWNGQQWVWQDQGTPPGTSVGISLGVITFPGTGSQAIYVFVIGQNDHLYVNWWNGQQWVWQDQGIPPVFPDEQFEPPKITITGSPTDSSGQIRITAGKAATLSWQVETQYPTDTKVSLTATVDQGGFPARLWRKDNLPLRGALGVTPTKNTFYELVATTLGPGVNVSSLGNTVVFVDPASTTPPPPLQGNVSAVAYYNCSDLRHSVQIWVIDQTAGTGWQLKTTLDPQWDESAQVCPGGAAPFVVQLTAGHQYELIAVDPNYVGCTGSDPNTWTSDCIRTDTHVIAGGGPGSLIVPVTVN